MTSRRCVRPEALDDLPPDDPQALRSRRDLRRVHRAMRSLSALEHAVRRLMLRVPPKKILELGAGDGTLLLRLAAALNARWPGVELTLLDRHRIVNSETVDAYGSLGWKVTTVCEDALTWVRQSRLQPHDLCITTLFLHHFRYPELRAMLEGVAAQSGAFIAIEPRREVLAQMGSRLIGLLGAGAVTREDAIKSVDAGFIGEEITSAWPAVETPWWTREFRVLPFSHCFIAARTDARILDA
jgi:hypothetical protein